MSIKCVIVDDEPLAIRVLEKHISNVPDLQLIATFDNAISAGKYLQESNVDLLFLDIQMPVVTGIDFVKNTDLQPKIIFTTAFREHALEGYELDIIDYLLKPISFIRFYKSINKYRALSSSKISTNKESLEIEKISNHIFVNSNKKLIKIAFDDMLFIDSIKDYVRIHTEKETITTKDKISSFIEKLPATFMRVHRSYIVNIDKVAALTAKDVVLTNDMEIPIGSSYKETIELIKKI
mgnify:CR=1 FL=1